MVGGRFLFLILFLARTDWYNTQFQYSNFTSNAGWGDSPEFIYPIDNMTVASGREASFTCVVNKLQGHKVSTTLLFKSGK